MRIDRVNHQMKRVIGEILQREFEDSRLTFVTITGVDTTKDLRHAKVYFSVLGNAKQIEDAQKRLDHARGLIRRFVGQKLVMRYLPELVFVYDNSAEISARIEQTLQEIQDDFKENQPGD